MRGYLYFSDLLTRVPGASVTGVGESGLYVCVCDVFRKLINSFLCSYRLAKYCSAHTVRGQRHVSTEPIPSDSAFIRETTQLTSWATSEIPDITKWLHGPRPLQNRPKPYGPKPSSVAQNSLSLGTRNALRRPFGLRTW